MIIPPSFSFSRSQPCSIAAAVSNDDDNEKNADNVDEDDNKNTDNEEENEEKAMVTLIRFSTFCSFSKCCNWIF